MKSKLEKPKPRLEKKYVQTNVGIMEQDKVNEVIDVDVSKYTVDGIKSQPVIVDDQASESSKSVPQALTVTSPAEVEQHNKFSMLVNVDVEADVVPNQPVIDADIDVEFDVNDQHDNVLENNDVVLEDNFDSDSSQDSAFVDATQFQNETVTEPVMTPERVQKDMNFLKQSWANMSRRSKIHLQKSSNSVMKAFKLNCQSNKRKLKRNCLSLVKILMQPSLRLIKDLSNEVCLLEYKGYG
jgi:hypothetical protein